MSNFSDGIEIYSDDSYNVDSDQECSHDSDDCDKEHFDGKMLKEFFKFGTGKFHFLKCMKNVFLRKYDKFFQSGFF